MYFSDNLGGMGDFKQTTIQENVNLTLLGKPPVQVACKVMKVLVQHRVLLALMNLLGVIMVAM